MTKRLMEHADPDGVTLWRPGRRAPHLPSIGAAIPSRRLGAQSSVVTGAVGCRQRRAETRTRGPFNAPAGQEARPSHPRTIRARTMPEWDCCGRRPRIATRVHRLHPPVGRRQAAEAAVNYPAGRTQHTRRVPMIEPLNVFTAAAPGGLVSVGPGWPSPTAWAIAGLAIAVLALIARWATGRRRRRVDAHVPTPGVGGLPHWRATTQRGLTQTEKPEKER